MSKSDDELNKLPFKVCIDDCHKKAIIHEDYCMNNCFNFDLDDFRYHPHTTKCFELSKEHFESFVECGSLLCLSRNQLLSLRPSYGRPKEKKPVIRELQFADEQSDCEDSVDYGNLGH